MKRELVVEHLKKKRKIVILTFALLMLAFLENSYLSCWKIYNFPFCEMGWIYAFLAIILLLVVFHYRK
jgi:hypothetical protein